MAEARQWVERSLWRIVRKVEIERERGERRAERKVRHTNEREREKKGDKMTERREKIIKKLRAHLVDCNRHCNVIDISMI